MMMKEIKKKMDNFLNFILRIFTLKIFSFKVKRKNCYVEVKFQR